MNRPTVTRTESASEQRASSAVSAESDTQETVVSSESEFFPDSKEPFARLPTALEMVSVSARNFSPSVLVHLDSSVSDVNWVTEQGFPNTYLEPPCNALLSCSGHGICVGTVKSYSCLCNLGRKGTFCEIPDLLG